jgi:hypothetical protein
MSWGNTYFTRLSKIPTLQNKCIKKIFFAHRRENAIPYFNLMGILSFDVFKLKIATFTYKIINDSENMPVIFENMVTPASVSHSHNTRFAAEQNICRPKTRTNYGIHTFKTISSTIWETIDYKIKCLPHVMYFQNNINKHYCYRKNCNLCM